MRTRFLLGLLTIIVLALALPAASLAASSANGKRPLPTAKTTVTDVKGVAHDVTIQVTHVAQQNGQLVANGYRYSATNGGKSGEVTPQMVSGNSALAIPINRGSESQGQALQAQALPPAPAGSCQILNLSLAPIHLDLLGLVLDTSQIDVRLIAVPGPGNLLGNLLCAVAGLLDPPTGGGGGGGQGVAQLLQNINNTLNAILARL